MVARAEIRRRMEAMEAYAPKSREDYLWNAGLLEGLQWVLGLRPPEWNDQHTPAQPTRTRL